MTDDQEKTFSDRIREKTEKKYHDIVGALTARVRHEEDIDILDCLTTRLVHVMGKQYDKLNNMRLPDEREKDP